MIYGCIEQINILSVLTAELKAFSKLDISEYTQALVHSLFSLLNEKLFPLVYPENQVAKGLVVIVVDIYPEFWSNMYIRNETYHTATAGALPSPAVQCIYVTPPLEVTALYNLLTTAGSRIRKSNASKSLLHPH